MKALSKEQRIFLGNYLSVLLNNVKDKQISFQNSKDRKKVARLRDRIKAVESELKVSSKDLEMLINLTDSGLKLTVKRVDLLSSGTPWYDKLILKRAKYNNIMSGLDRIKRSHEGVLATLKEMYATKERNRSNSRSKKS